MISRKTISDTSADVMIVHGEDVTVTVNTTVLVGAPLAHTHTQISLKV